MQGARGGLDWRGYVSSRSCADVEVSSAGVRATVMPEGVLCSGGSEHQWRVVGAVFGTGGSSRRRSVELSQPAVGTHSSCPRHRHFCRLPVSTRDSFEPVAAVRTSLPTSPAESRRLAFPSDEPKKVPQVSVATLGAHGGRSWSFRNEVSTVFGGRSSQWEGLSIPTAPVS